MTPASDNRAVCTFCGAGGGQDMYETRSIQGEVFAVRRCEACGAAYLWPKPTAEQLVLAYDDSYYGQGEKKFAGWIEAVLDYFRTSRARLVARHLRKPGRVLDIGCGNGRFLGYMIQRGYEGYGIELPGKAAQRARQITGLTLKTGTLARGDFPEGYFDAVTLWHVFEHLPQPQETLEIIAGILKPQGYLFLSQPNIDSVQARVFRGQWLHLDPPKHLFFLGTKDLIRELREYGFSCIRQRHFSLEQNPFGMQQSLLNCLLSQRDMLFEILKGHAGNLRAGRLNILGQKLFWVGTSWFFVLLSLLEAAARRGGTIELAFRKADR